ncbi:DUF4339 domain-containing protein [Bradyrhizobium daqingense]|uniref:Uncharacterized protein DUF4339 n=1 Tax=Bradyrhizobium daqingense TaxID=993502 RepID=A0A562LMJ5_9BRAD|nr:DUF4339 domain-containing protein [Bradyrhizobium daqingense]TWI08842.1 uncharacterized protein DUF4339 [Bradyrhizobium daqingense]UFS87249.1 DUF4339 domain-containing protein [Bradyrhizobium daqingense]
MDWHVIMRGEQHGPLSRDQVLQHLQDGQLVGTDLIWRPGFSDWKPVSELAQFWQPPRREPSSPPLPRGADFRTAPSEFEGVPLSRLVDTRHELTALIKQNLYGGGSKQEGQAALTARNSLDKFIFGMTDDHLVTGSADDLRPLKSGIILETYGELLEILDDYARRFGNGGKAVKQGMAAIACDPDVLGRFDSARKAAIQAIAGGLAMFAQGRFEKLHLSIRTEAGNSEAWRESKAARGS